MLDENRSICLHRLSRHFKLLKRIWMNEFPNRVVYFLNVHAHFLMSWKSSICKWRNLTWVQVQRLLNDYRVRLNSNLLTILYNFIWSIFFSSLDNEHWSCNWMLKFWIRSTGISFFMSCNFISKVKWEIWLCLLIQKHDLVSESNQPIFWEWLWYFLEWSSIL